MFGGSSVPPDDGPSPSPPEPCAACAGAAGRLACRRRRLASGSCPSSAARLLGRLGAAASSAASPAGLTLAAAPAAASAPLGGRPAGCLVIAIRGRALVVLARRGPRRRERLGYLRRLEYHQRRLERRRPEPTAAGFGRGRSATGERGARPASGRPARTAAAWPPAPDRRRLASAPAPPAAGRQCLPDHRRRGRLGGLADRDRVERLRVRRLAGCARRWLGVVRRAGTGRGSVPIGPAWSAAGADFFAASWPPAAVVGSLARPARRLPAARGGRRPADADAGCAAGAAGRQAADSGARQAGRR